MISNFLSIKIIGLVVLCTTLAACDERHYTADKPRINYWEVVDSYGNSNLAYNHHRHGNYHDRLYIDPSIDDGYFELWWDVSNYDDYSVSILINDSPSIFGSYELERTYCGIGLDCDYEGFAYCFYDNRGYDSISCSTHDYQSRDIDITHLMSGHPSKLFMILEVCDSYSGYCDVQSQPVIFE
ncbi:MAG TPA: hypothetical protein VIC26_11730 [Marinagarivorans sp.]